MRNLINDAAHRRRVLTRYRLVELGNAKAPDDVFLLFGIADRASVILDRDISAARIFCFLCHDLYNYEFQIINYERQPLWLVIRNW